MNYKIKQGDCLELMKNLPDHSVDMILADLPYGILSSEKWDQCLPLDQLWEQYKRLIKNNGCIALFGQEPFSSRLRLSNVEWYRYDWIWQKSQAGGAMLSHDRPLRSYETISIFSQNKTVFHPPLESQDRFDDKQRYPKDIIYFSNRRKKSYHPTQKPVRLLEYLIQTYTEEGDTVLDNTMGSGSTGVAALATKRKFIGYELESNFYQIAKRRIEHESESNVPYLPPRLLDVDQLDNQQPKIPSWIENL